MRRLATLLLCLLLARSAAAQTLLIDRIVVRVNDRIATMTDFERQLGERRQAILAEQGLSEPRRRELLESAGRDVLTDIYQELLLLSRSDQMGAKVSDTEVDHALAQTRERMGLQTDEQLHQALAVSGLTEASLRDRLRQSLLVQEVMGREVQPRLRIEEEDQRRYYREHQADFTLPAAVRLQEVIVLGEGRSPDELVTAAKKVHDELAAGSAVEEVAKRGAAAGTTTPLVDLGWVNAGDLDPDLEHAAWDLQPGAFTAPVPGRGGRHIVKLLERRPAALRPFDEVTDQITERLQQTRMGAEYNVYLRELEKRSYIALKVPPEAEGFKGLAEEAAPPTAPVPGAPVSQPTPAAEPGADRTAPAAPVEPPATAGSPPGNPGTPRSR